METDTTPVYAAGGVVYRVTATGKIQILLIKKRGGFWSLPKGRINSGEAAPDAALREVTEETGIVGIAEEFIGITRYTLATNRHQQVKEVAYYLVRSISGSLRPQRREQINQLRWMSIPEALQRIQRPRLQVIVRSAQILLAGRRRRSG